MRLPLAFLVLGLLVLPGCGGGDDGSSRGSERPADLSRLVVVGDSLSAGVQNGTLVQEIQRHAYPALVARQAGVDLPLPLLAPDRLDPQRPFRVNPEVQPFDLAVPGARTRSVLVDRPSRPIDSLVDLILGLPGLEQGISRSQVEWAETLAPTTVILWIGNNDLLTAATNGDPSRVTPIDDFTRDFTEVTNRLEATGASLVVVNVPDVTVVPFLTPAADVAAGAGQSLEVVGPALGVGQDDYLTPDGTIRAAAILAGTARGPLGDSQVLDAQEVAAVRIAVAEVNKVIAARAAAAAAALVDVHGLLAQIDADGLEVGGRRLTTEPRGGLFSADGIHPSDTGYAVIANAVIDAIDSRFGNAIPRVDVAAVLEQDPLAP